MTGLVSVQDHYSEVRERLAAAVRELKSGDPRREDTFIGPLISEKQAQRVQDWVSEAVARGREPCPALCMHRGVSGHAAHDVAYPVVLCLPLIVHCCSRSLMLTTVLAVKRLPYIAGKTAPGRDP